MKKPPGGQLSQAQKDFNLTISLFLQRSNVWSVYSPLAGLAERAGAIATSSHKFQCDRPFITFPELSLDAIATSAYLTSAFGRDLQR